MHVDSLVRPIEVVCVADPALDMSRAEREEYGRTRDPANLREHPGRRAVRYVCKPLSVAEASVVDQRQSMADRLLWSFMLGVTEIIHAGASGPQEGARIVPTRPFDGPTGRRCIWSDVELESLQEALGRAAFFEVGGVIYERTLRGKAAGVSVPYTLPQSSLDALDWIERLHAERRSDTRSETPST